ncbi:hypothetical protein V6N00_13270 [Tersicoccus sp. MR15.9]|uniref:hypothetical protein n=1 Tax=Tersicoccus mangrovi TaxID=3121635 RepID=UPI002FE5B6A7
MAEIVARFLPTGMEPDHPHVEHYAVTVIDHGDGTYAVGHGRKRLTRSGRWADRDLLPAAVYLRTTRADAEESARRVVEKVRPGGGLTWAESVVFEAEMRGEVSSLAGAAHMTGGR